MNCHWRRAAAPIAIMLAVSGCSGSIPREDVPAGWALDVHQPGAWWTEPVIPRSVIIQRCSPPSGWGSEPDLSVATALPPGSDVEFSFLFDDYHCSTGWSEPATEGVEFTVAEMVTEEGLRRICSGSGLPMDDGWRFLGHQPAVRAGYEAAGRDADEEAWDSVTAAFTDEYGAVVGCLVEHVGDAGGLVSVALASGTDAEPAVAACPVTGSEWVADEGTVGSYRLRGAGAVRGDDGKVLTDAATLELGLAGDGVTSSHPVVEGIAIVDGWMVPQATIPLDWDQPPPVAGRVYAADGELLATCGG